MKQEIIWIDLGGVNCYLGKEENNFILFDTGGHLILDKRFSDRCEVLIAELERLGCKPGNLRLIVLTHGDCDHVANAATIREKYQTQIAMCAEDLHLIRDLSIAKLMGSLKFRSLILKVIFLIMKKPIQKVSRTIFEDFKPFEPDIFLHEGDFLSEYGFIAKVLHIPGHTEGSIGILTEGNDLIAGDIMTNIKKPAAALNADDFKKLDQNIERLKRMNINTVFPGHGKPFKMNDIFKIKR